MNWRQSLADSALNRAGSRVQVKYYNNAETVDPLHSNFHLSLQRERENWWLLLFSKFF
jgi:hypothetical protein